MRTLPLENVNILSTELLPTPQELSSRLPATGKVAATVNAQRNAIKRVLTRDDHRVVVVVGPCSIHDIDTAKEYARAAASTLVRRS